MAPRWPQMIPSLAKIAPWWPQEGPRVPQDGPRRAKRAPRWPQEGPKRAQEGPKRASRGPQRAQRWPQDGPRGAKMRPRWANIAQDNRNLMQEGPIAKTFKNLRKNNVFEVSRPPGKAQHVAKMGLSRAKLS